MVPSASILIPAYNAQHWIAAALDSAVHQVGADVEVIVVDDGSSDGTVDVASTFGHKIRLKTGPNRGAPAARNTALAMARAPWVQYLDADDYLASDKIANSLAGVAANPDADVVYGPATIEWHRRNETHLELEEIPEPHDPYLLLALWKLPQTGAPLFRKSALEDVGGWREDQPCCQEHELYLRLLIAGKRFFYHAENGAVYRRFEAGTLSTKDPAKVRYERAKIEARLKAHLVERGELTGLRQWAIDQAYFDMARSAWPKDRTEARTLHAAISSRRFRPHGCAAPPAYRLAYRLLGFEGAERMASVRRTTHFRRESPPVPVEKES